MPDCQFFMLVTDKPLSLDGVFFVYINKYMFVWRYWIIVVSLSAETIKATIMTSLSFSDFRKNMASSFDLVDAGEKVYINRGSRKTYAIIPVEDGDLAITPALEAKIEKARKEFREGKTISLKTHEDIERYFDSM